MKGIVDESGKFHFMRSDLAQFIGTASTTGGALAAGFEGFTQLGTHFEDGSTHGTGTLSGAVVERASLTLTYQFSTDGGAASKLVAKMDWDDDLPKVRDALLSSGLQFPLKHVTVNLAPSGVRKVGELVVP